MSNPREALKHLNIARRDSKWSSSATLSMVEIYLDPENDVSWASEGVDDVPATKSVGEQCCLSLQWNLQSRLSIRLSAARGKRCGNQGMLTTLKSRW
jgi:hypothetical protein